MMGTCTTAGTAAARAPIDSDCGALDTAGVDGRMQRRSKYGTKRPKAKK